MADMDQGALGTRTSGHEGGRWADKHLEALAAGHEGPTPHSLTVANYHNTSTTYIMTNPHPQQELYKILCSKPRV